MDVERQTHSMRETAKPIASGLDSMKAPITPAQVRYIKLGRGGSWEKECREKGIIRMGFDSGCRERFSLCTSRSWNELTQSFQSAGKQQAVSQRYCNELRFFFEDDGTTLWTTFMAGRLYWGALTGEAARPHPDGDGVFREVKGGWCSTDISGDPLTKDNLSGALTRLAMFRGTSCEVKVAPYVIRRINGENGPEVKRAIVASSELRAAILGLMRMLTPQDFELLVDLIFTTSGWRRVGTVGKTQETVDFDLVLPSTGQRAFVQVKSRTSASQLAEYVAKLEERLEDYDRMFFVHHSGSPGRVEHSHVTLLGPIELAAMTLEAGLTDWLIRKVS